MKLGGTTAGALKDMCHVTSTPARAVGHLGGPVRAEGVLSHSQPYLKPLKTNQNP